MSLTLAQTATALAPRLSASFHAAGGTDPIVYTVTPSGAGGTIDPDTGVYTAPASVSSDPRRASDQIVATDSLGATGTASILVGSPLMLLCEVIQREMGLDDGRVVLWNQKNPTPQDTGLFIVVSEASSRPFANTNRQVTGGGLESQQTINVISLVDIDIMSRGPAARELKEDVVMSLASNYAKQQQVANSFYFGSLPAHGRMVNISSADAAAIPFRYRLSINVQYAKPKTTAVDYFDNNLTFELTNDY